MRLAAGPKASKANFRGWTEEFRADVEARGSAAVIEFLETHIRHVKGPNAGELFRVEEWQRRDIIEPIFDEREPDGMRTYQVVTLGVPRKNGKSFLASALAIVGIFLEDGAEVALGAKTRKQAGVVLDVARHMVLAEPKLGAMLHVYANSIVFESTFSSIIALGADGRNALGLNPSLVILDEFAFYGDGGEEFYRALSTAQGARAEPLLIEISTAGESGEGFGWRRWSYCRKVRDGVVEDPSHLVVLFEMEDDEDWRDPEVWARVNPNYGVSVQEKFLRRELVKAEENVADAMAFQMFYGNRWVSAAHAWMDLEAWDRCGGETEIEKGQRAFVGIDLGSTDDLSALVVVVPQDDGTRHVEARFYCPESKIERARDGVNYSAWAEEGFVTVTPGEVTDYDFIRRDLNEIADRLKLVEARLDRWNATEFSIRCDEDDGLPMKGMGQGYASMASAVVNAERYIYDSKLRHGSNPVLRWCIANAVPVMDDAGNRKLSKNKSTGKIDGAIGLLMAIAAADAHAVETKSPRIRTL